MLDVGTGDGLLARRAIARCGSGLHVTMTDISAPLLEHAEAKMTALGLRAQCSFHRCSAEKLEPVADASVDVVTTRAVLAYVADRPAAFAEFRRVLKPGGRVSIAEPILQDEAFLVRALRKRIENPAAPPDPLLPLLHRWKSAQFPDTEQGCAESPIANFAERDLLNFARNAGFVNLHLELHIDVTPSLIKSWDVFLACSPHPWAPPLRAILAERFSADERALFEKLLRPTVESGRSTTTERIAYLSATSP